MQHQDEKTQTQTEITFQKQIKLICKAGSLLSNASSIIWQCESDGSWFEEKKKRQLRARKNSNASPQTFQGLNSHISLDALRKDKPEQS